MPEREYKFADDRRWRFDFAWPEIKVAVEVEGLSHGRPVICHRCRSTVKSKNGRVIMQAGRHGSMKGMQTDAEKYNCATFLGWRVFRYTNIDLERRASDVIREMFHIVGVAKPLKEATNLFTRSLAGADVESRRTCLDCGKIVSVSATKCPMCKGEKLA